LELNFSDDKLLSPGSGELAILYFTCREIGTTSFVIIDTTEVNSVNFSFQLGELYDFVTAYPDFTPGSISIDIPTDIETETPNALPAEFSLAQNQPNPFNPATFISFSLPERSHVRLEVFNILGQQVRTIADQVFPAGIHSVTFDGRDNKDRQIASGVYLYRIKTDKHEQSRKMVLLK
jgi:hypothetical protein